MNKSFDYDILTFSPLQVVLPCVVTNKVGVLQWTKDGFGLGVQRELPGFPRYSMDGDQDAGDFSLEITALAPEDDAVFQCQVSYGIFASLRMKYSGERCRRGRCHQI